MVPREVLDRKFTLDGAPSSIIEFIVFNVECGHFDVADIEEIRLLGVGETITYGGGAAATFTLTRVA